MNLRSSNDYCSLRGLGYRPRQEAGEDPLVLIEPGLTDPVFSAADLDSPQFFEIGGSLLRSGITIEEMAIVRDLMNQEFSRRVQLMAIAYGMGSPKAIDVLRLSLAYEYTLYPEGGQADAYKALMDAEIVWLKERSWWERAEVIIAGSMPLDLTKRHDYLYAVYKQAGIPLPVKARFSPSSLSPQAAQVLIDLPGAVVPGVTAEITPPGAMITSDLVKGLAVVGVGVAAIFIIKDMVTA